MPLDGFWTRIFLVTCPMTVAWSFYSFSKDRWDAIFGGGLEGAEAAVVQSATWDEDAWPEADREPRVRIARRIVRNGISYAGLSRKERELLDEMFLGFFCPEGLEELLGFEYESPDFVRMVLVDAVLARVAPRFKSPLLVRLFGRDGAAGTVRLLPLLATGRRLNGSGKPRDPYLILSPEEVSQLHGEMGQAVSAPAPWPGAGWEESARRCLLDVFARVREKRKWLAGRFC